MDGECYPVCSVAKLKIFVSGIPKLPKNVVHACAIFVQIWTLVTSCAQVFPFKGVTFESKVSI